MRSLVRRLAPMNAKIQALNKAYPDLATESNNRVQNFNKYSNAEYNQSFRVIINQGVTTSVPVLSSSGKFLNGINILVASFASLGDTTISFSVNNRTVLVDVCALMLIPNYIQGGMLFVPTPQELVGKDTFKVSFNKNDAGAVTVFYTLSYVPQL
jgi:hypothetical protein